MSIDRSKLNITKKKIDESILYLILTEYSWNKKEYMGWQMIEKKLTSSDQEDGGGHYDVIIKDTETGKFYLTQYCDWDIDNTDFDRKTGLVMGRCDLGCDLTEVIPTQKTITVYIPVEKRK